MIETIYEIWEPALKRWIPMSKRDWVRKEREAGFHNTMGQPNEPGTAGFSNGKITGRIRYEKKEGHIKKRELVAVMGGIGKFMNWTDNGKGARVSVKLADGTQFWCIVPSDWVRAIAELDEE